MYFGYSQMLATLQPTGLHSSLPVPEHGTLRMCLLAVPPAANGPP
jgi:hypothetical protein